MEPDVDLGTHPVSEWDDLVQRIFSESKKEVLMSNITDIKADVSDVDAHL